MKSAVFYGKHDLRVEESIVPEPGPTEVLIQVMACGICGTDIHIYEGDTPYIEQVQFRMQDRKIDIWDAREKDINPAKLQEGDKLILAADSKYREIFDKLYERSWEAGHLCLYYNP